MTADSVTYFVGAVCFGLGTAFGVRLRDHITVPAAAALVAPVAVLGTDVEPALFLIGPLVAAVALLIARRLTVEVPAHVVLFGIATAAVLLLEIEQGTTRAFAFSLVCPIAYSLLETARQQIGRSALSSSGPERRMWWLFVGVLVSASGLIVLVAARMGWPVFVAMAVVLALTRREFEAFALSRTAYQQTVRSLRELTGLRNS